MATTMNQLVNAFFDEYKDLELAEQFDVSKVLLRDEIDALKTEYGSANVKAYDTDGVTLLVTIGPIVLRNPADGELKDLGKFRIEIPLTAIMTKAAMKERIGVVAIDPVYPITEEGEIDDVPHPNVQEDNLCFGEGLDMCYSALQQGRLFDFVTLVHTILNSVTETTEGHVSVEEWFGAWSECADCGDRESDEDMVKCPECGDKFCENCKPDKCSGCEKALCSNCANFVHCNHCGNHKFCEVCRGDNNRCRNCDACNETYCVRCFNLDSHDKLVKIKNTKICAVCLGEDTDHDADREIKELDAFAKKLAKE